MDLIAVDVTDLDKSAVRRGHMVTLIGEGITVDELAHHFGTIGYEVLTSLGRRFVRIYKGGDAVAATNGAATEKSEAAATQAAPPALPTAAAAAAPPPLPAEPTSPSA